jgi:hypothetical protein
VTSQASAVPTLCLGIDVTWWGGSPGRRASQRDTIVYSIVQGGTSPDVHIDLVDLSAARNPVLGPTEANFDAYGKLLVDRVAAILDENKGRFQRCIVALDAPLEARLREDQPPRKKAVPKDVKTGAERRECEHAIQRHKGLSTRKEAKAWHSGLIIQSGSPVAPRIASILEKLKTECGFVCWGMDRTIHERQVIEIFPSEAIWSLGLQGGFPGTTPSDVRSYKKKKPTSFGQEEAMDTAMRPLLGFAKCFESQVGLPVRRWSEQIAEYACPIATDNHDVRLVRKGKGFDDPIESGIAFLTAVSFVYELFHPWGVPSDGTIVGPGFLPGYNEIEVRGSVQRSAHSREVA